MSSALNITARTLRALHKPGDPLVVANVHDAITAKAIASLPSTKALATASWSVAAAAGLEDNALDIATNIRAASAIAPIAKDHNLPLTVDFQDGYGDLLESGIKQLIDIGVSGINLEDTNNATGTSYTINEASARIKTALSIAASHGVPEFVINARTDTLLHGGTLEDAILRGKAYLASGAANVFVWGGSSRGGITKAEVKRLVEAFGGKLNVIVKIGAEGALTVSELREIGVSRCSIGPSLVFPAMKAYKEAAETYIAS